MKNKLGKIFLDILKIPNQILRNPNKEIDNHDLYKPLIVNMLYTMNKVNGIGIAAPQVGVNERVFIALIDKKPVVFINAKVVEFSSKIISFEEKCLSVPGESVLVTRPYEILVEYQDLKGRVHNKNLEGFNSVVFLHEFDHVLSEGGRLIIDYKDMK